MAANREALINQFFEDMGTFKRGLAAQTHALTSRLPISRAQWELLATIRHAQPINFKQLAALLYLSPGAVSQLADGLEHKQLLVREYDPNDRRIQCLRLSKKGEKLVLDIEKMRRVMLKQAMQHLTTDELATWLHLQQKLITSFHTINKQPKEEKAK